MMPYAKRSVFLSVVAAICFDSKLRPSVAFINKVPSSTHQIRSPQSLHTTYSQGSRITSLLSSNTESSNNDFIRSLLTNDAGDDDPYSKYTHQIAIPLGDASELHSALHAIQTSLVRDCPRLIRACVMPALLRLPLLYVDGSSLGLNVGSSSGPNVETILESVVHRSIMEVVYGQEADNNGVSSSSTASSSTVPLVEMAQPILLPFRGLELQGDDNSVLYAVGHNINDKNSKKKQSRYDEEDEDDGVIIVDDWSDDSSSTPSGWETLEALVKRIQSILESEYDCKTQWPNDEAQGEELDYDDPLVAAIKQKEKKWRPRVPFVRLPTDFYQELEKSLEEKVSRGLSDEEEELSPIDMGLDGISPLFWYDAWGEEEIIPPEPGVRMRSVAIYRRMVPGGGEAESSFYVPASDALQSWKRGLGDDTDSSSDGINMDLPSGDNKLMAKERREQAQAMERLGEEERRAEREWEEGKAQWINDLDNVESDSEDFTEMNIGMETGEVTVEGEAAYASPWAERGVTDEDTDESGDDSTEEAPSSTDPAAETNAQTTNSRKELPSIEENPIFKRLREGKPQITAQGQTSVQPLDSSSTEEALPPYPSDPHFTGIWRIVSSPFGDSGVEGDGLSSASDNFIFRVDGGVAGGPILNAEYQQKAAGGSWKFFQAQLRKSNPDEIPVTQSRLRVRLLVPPEKSQTLVIEGEINRLVSPNADDVSSSSSSDAWRMASGGMLDGMSSKLMQGEDGTDVKTPSRGQSQDAMIFCRGEAWLEDTEDGSNRKKLGPIALMKLKTPDRNQLIYTVPASKGPSGEDDDDEEEED
mmetsp:Transcript_30845/g.62193  ORF Transcript_30845/g.62193 Transcript_30845/m.62193 type:complete len:814 (-) Transcript_30845:40-2481(-)